MASWSHQSRRDFLLTASLSCALNIPGRARGQEAKKTAGSSVPRQQLTPLNRFPRMVQEYFVGQVCRAEELGNKRRELLKTREDAEKYVKSVRAMIAESFGPFPEKTPLKPRVTGVVERETYRIEKIIFESRPDFFVTANLYVPKGRPFPLPGVVGSCGHSANGKAAITYQSFAQGLARLGYVTLIFDPIGQGERSQYAHVESKHRPQIGVGEHIHMGNQQVLVGEFFGTWRAWDGIRALDYLLSRPEVDPKHVGITGNSGGGTMTTWLCGLESRWTMAAPGCFVTTFRRNMENELPADDEQCPPQVLKMGLDHSDFLAAMAPKPVIILSQERDYFDTRGAHEAYQRLQRLYSLLGAEDNIRLHVGPDPHGYSIANREAMYRWFNRSTGVSDATKEPQLTMEKDETLQCTETGNVAELKSRTVFSFTKEKAESLAKARPKKVDVQKELAAAFQVQGRVPVPDYRILRALKSRGYPKPHFTTYAVNTEDNAFAIVYRLSNEPHLSRPPANGRRAILYVSHLSSDAELREEPLIADLLKEEPEAEFWTCDVRGTGESQPDTCGENTFLTNYGSDYFYSAHSLMLGRSYLAQKTFDVLSVLSMLESAGHANIHLVGKGRGTLPATFAAVLSDEVKQVTLKNAMRSYHQLAVTEDFDWPLSALVPDVLQRFDLDDCYSSLESKKLKQIDMWGEREGG